MESLLSDLDARDNPLDILEELVTANDWRFDRSSDSELRVEIGGRWCAYHMDFIWQEEVAAIFFTCRFDHRVPPAKRDQVHALLAAVNENLWLGHFDLASAEAMPMFRHTIPLRGVAGVSVEQLEDLVDTAVVECEHFYPALQLVVWGGRSVADALASVMMETVGEA